MSEEIACPTFSNIVTVSHVYTEHLRIYKPPPIKCSAFIDLKPKTRAIFILHLAGFTGKEICQVFGISLFAVYRRIARAYVKYPIALRFKKH